VKKQNTGMEAAAVHVMSACTSKRINTTAFVKMVFFLITVIVSLAMLNV
jgi:hypothetical protein